MRWTNTTPLFRPALLLLLLICCCCAGVSADPVTVNFQSLGLMHQDVKVFDETGSLIATGNTTSSVILNSSESTFYTIQLQPSATNQDPVNLLDNTVAWLTQNAMIIALLLFVLLVLVGRRR